LLHLVGFLLYHQHLILKIVHEYLLNNIGGHAGVYFGLRVYLLHLVVNGQCDGRPKPVVALLNFANVAGLGVVLDEMAILKLKAAEFVHVEH